MDIIEQSLSALRQQIKDDIALMLITLYKIKHNGQMPNWENGDEFVIEDAENDNCHLTIFVMNDPDIGYFEITIDRFILTLDGVLYFYSVESNDEYEWTEIGTEELMRIRNVITNYYNEVISASVVSIN